jgi:ABC-type lipoprotein export system ATPase subunit
MTTNLLLDIAWTHVTARVRQTLVGMAGVAIGVGFTIMMAGLMQGSQIDFLRQLVDTMPHITVQDERRSAPAQPADRDYGAVQMSSVANVGGRRGIKYPDTVMTSLRSWLPGDVAPSVKTTAIINHGRGRIGITLVGIDPRQEVRVSKLVSQMREGQITDLNRSPNAIIIGQALAEKLAVKTGNTVTLIGGEGTEVTSTVVGLFRSGLQRVDEGQVYSLLGFAQVMMGQSGIINELRLRLDDPLIAQKVATQVEAQTRLQVGVLAGGKLRPTVELLGARFHRADGHGRDAADVILCDLQHHLHDHAREASGYCDHEVAWHAGKIGAADLHHRSRDHRCSRNPVRLGARLCALLRLVQDHDLRHIHRHDRAAVDLLFADALYRGRRNIPALLHRRGLLPCAQGDAGASRRDHPGRLMSDVALEAVGLVRRIEGAISHTLVNGIDLKVEKGEFLATTGPSGSGKSSLLYLLGLLDAPTEGEVIICGQPTSKLSESERADVRLTKCGFVFQFHFLLPEFTSLQNVLLPMRAAGKMSETEMRERGLELLASLGLKDHADKRPNQLSGGQRQRVAIARALSNRPEVIVADEPTGALDTSSTEQVFAILREIADSGRTVVVVTHDPALAARADRRLNIVDGRIQEMSLGDGRVSSAAVVAER